MSDNLYPDPRFNPPNIENVVGNGTEQNSMFLEVFDTNSVETSNERKVTFNIRSLWAVLRDMYVCAEVDVRKADGTVLAAADVLDDSNYYTLNKYFRQDWIKSLTILVNDRKILVNENNYNLKQFFKTHLMHTKDDVKYNVDIEHEYDAFGDSFNNMYDAYRADDVRAISATRGIVNRRLLNGQRFVTHIHNEIPQNFFLAPNQNKVTCEFELNPPKQVFYKWSGDDPIAAGQNVVAYPGISTVTIKNFSVKMKYIELTNVGIVNYFTRLYNGIKFNEVSTTLTVVTSNLPRNGETTIEVPLKDNGLFLAIIPFNTNYAGVRPTCATNAQFPLTGYNFRNNTTRINIATNDYDELYHEYMRMCGTTHTLINTNVFKANPFIIIPLSKYSGKRTDIPDVDKSNRGTETITIHHRTIPGGNTYNYLCLQTYFQQWQIKADKSAGNQLTITTLV